MVPSKFKLSVIFPEAFLLFRNAQVNITHRTFEGGFGSIWKIAAITTLRQSAPLLQRNHTVVVLAHSLFRKMAANIEKLIFQVPSFASRSLLRCSSLPHQFHDHLLLEVVKVVLPRLLGLMLSYLAVQKIGIVGTNLSKFDHQLHVPAHLFLVLSHRCHLIIAINPSHVFPIL